jgi:hypothetical protein
VAVRRDCRHTSLAVAADFAFQAGVVDVAVEFAFDLVGALLAAPQLATISTAPAFRNCRCC